MKRMLTELASSAILSPSPLMATAPNAPMTMSKEITIQAPIGGELHKLSDKFYKGGQFMPDDNVFPASRKKAAKKAGWLGEFRRPSISAGMGVYVETFDGRRHIVLAAKSLDEADAVIGDLRRVIEIRLGGEALNWDS